MLTCGIIFNVADRVRILTGASPTVTHRYGGFAFGASGRLCISTDTPAGSRYVKGFRQNADGAIYGVNSASAPDHYVGPYGFDANDALIFGNIVPAFFIDGVGFVSTGRLSTINS